MGVMVGRGNDARAARLRQAREAAGFGSASSAARSLGITESTYLAHENASRNFNTEVGQVYARRFHVDFAWLMTGAEPKSHAKTHANSVDKSGKVQQIALRGINIVGAVQAGVWVETMDIAEPYEVPLPVAPQYRTTPLIGLEVRGPSMDLVYPSGALVVCAKFMDLGRNPRHGERVVAIRSRDSGDVEASLKEYRIDADGVARLWPRSTHPDHQAPQPADAPDVRIAYLVVGSYRPE